MTNPTDRAAPTSVGSRHISAVLPVLRVLAGGSAVRWMWSSRAPSEPPRRLRPVAARPPRAAGRAWCTCAPRAGGARLACCRSPATIRRTLRRRSRRQPATPPAPARWRSPRAAHRPKSPSRPRCAERAHRGHRGHPHHQRSLRSLAVTEVTSGYWGHRRLLMSPAVTDVTSGH